MFRIGRPSSTMPRQRPLTPAGLWTKTPDTWTRPLPLRMDVPSPLMSTAKRQRTPLIAQRSSASPVRMRSVIWNPSLLPPASLPLWTGSKTASWNARPRPNPLNTRWRRSAPLPAPAIWTRWQTRYWPCPMPPGRLRRSWPRPHTAPCLPDPQWNPL